MAHFSQGARHPPTNVTHGADFTPNIEAILSLKPDVVFQWATIGNDPIEVLDRVGLRKLGIRTGTQSDTDAYVAMVGQVAGKAGVRPSSASASNNAWPRSNPRPRSCRRNGGRVCSICARHWDTP